MYAQVEKPKENKSQAATNSIAQKKSNVKQALGFVDNRPDMVAQRELQARVNNVISRKGKVNVNNDAGVEKEADVMGARAFQRVEDLGALQHSTSISNFNNEGLIQRMVLNLDPKDPTIASSSTIEKDRQKKGGLDSLLWTEQHENKQPLTGLSGKEELAIVAHGTPKFGEEDAKVAGKTPEKLFDYLIEKGLKNNWNGNLHLSACTGAWSRLASPSFAERLATIFSERGFSVSVSGYEGFAQSESADKEIESDPADREERLMVYMLHRPVSEIQGLMEYEQSQSEINAQNWTLVCQTSVEMIQEFTEVKKSVLSFLSGDLSIDKKAVNLFLQPLVNIYQEIKDLEGTPKLSKMVSLMKGLKQELDKSYKAATQVLLDWIGSLKHDKKESQMETFQKYYHNIDVLKEKADKQFTVFNQGLKESNETIEREKNITLQGIIAMGKNLEVEMNSYDLEKIKLFEQILEINSSASTNLKKLNCGPEMNNTLYIIKNELAKMQSLFRSKYKVGSKTIPATRRVFKK